MSIHVMSWVFKNSPATLGDRLVLLILADKADDDGTNARPSVPSIALQARLSERQVQRCLRNLEAAGAIKKTGTYRYPGQRNGVNVYQVLRPKGDILSADGDIHDIQTVTPTSPNPSLEPVQKEPIAAAPRNGHPPRRSKADLNAIWDTLTDIFGPVTVRSAEALRGKHVQELGAAGATREEIMRRAKSWPQHFDSATLTAPALVKHWDTLGRKPLRRR